MTTLEQEPGMLDQGLSFQESMETVVPEKMEERDADLEIQNESGFANHDEKMYSLSKHEGWAALKEYIQTSVQGLRTDIGIKPGETPEVYGARRLAADAAIAWLETVISQVEMSAEYVRREDEKRKRAGQ